MSRGFRFDRRPSVMLSAAVLALAVVLPASSIGATWAGAAGALVVQASGFKQERGHAVAKLFRPGDNVLGRGTRQATSAITTGRASFSFGNLPAGRYAVVVFHDENGNGTIDHNAMGLPSEPLGFSNGFALSLVSGLPRFDKLQFEHPGGKQLIEIAVR